MVLSIFMAVINPGSVCTLEEAMPGKTLGELLDTPITLHEFKCALREKSVAFDEAFLVTAIVQYTPFAWAGFHFW